MDSTASTNEVVDKMKVTDLKKILIEKGLSTLGNKQELIDRITKCSELSELNIEGKLSDKYESNTEEEDLMKREQVKMPDWVAVMCDKMSDRTEEIIRKEIKGIENKMETKFKKLEDKLDRVAVDHLQKIKEVNQRVDKIEDKIKEKADEQMRIIESQKQFETKLEKLYLEKVEKVEYFKEDLLEKISFSDSRRDNPKDFIEILETVRVKSNIPFKIRIGRCLQGEAKSWWDIVQQKVADKQELEQSDYFIKLFKEKFMGLKFQQMVTNDLITGNYKYFQTKCHPCAYFSNLLRRARSCQQPLMEEEICDYIARHFGKKFEDAWIAQPNRSADCFYELIERFGVVRIKEDVGAVQQTNTQGGNNNNNHYNNRSNQRGNNNNDNYRSNQRGNNYNGNYNNEHRARGSNNNYNNNGYQNNNRHYNNQNNQQPTVNQISVEEETEVYNNE